MKKTMTAMIIALLTAGHPALAHEHEMGGKAAEAQTGSLYDLKDTWATSDKKPFHLEDLAGQPAVIAMVYTHCKDICPRTIEEMKRLERGLPPALLGRVRFAVFSFDTERDTEARLKEFAQAHGIDTPNWTLLRGEPATVQRLAVALGVKYKKRSDGDFEHDALIVVLDKNGVIVHRRNFFEEGPEETRAALKKLAE